LGFLWLNAKLDVLVVQCYAPGHSRFNPIERTWSFLTAKITGVILPDDINGKVPTVNDNDAWLKVLDNAAVLCSRFWNDKVYNDFKIKAKPFLSDHPLIEPIKKTHISFKEFTKSTNKSLTTVEDFVFLRKTYVLFVKHVNRKPYQIEFVRCTDSLCNYITFSKFYKETIGYAIQIP